jgi:septal ring factor EnvC (AmiA/AmiB activator)
MIIEPLTLGIGTGLFLLGYIAKSNNDNKSSLAKVDAMLEQNKNLIELSSTIEILNRDIDRKNNHISDLTGEISHQEENINTLIERADYVRNSGELEKLEELAQVSKNLKQLKGVLTKFQRSNTDVFNKGVLISLVQNLYEYIHKEEIDMEGIKYLMSDFTDSERDEKGDSFGGMNNNKAPKAKSTPTRGM